MFQNDNNKYIPMTDERPQTDSSRRKREKYNRIVETARIEVKINNLE